MNTALLPACGITLRHLVMVVAFAVPALVACMLPAHAENRQLTTSDYYWSDVDDGEYKHFQCGTSSVLVGREHEGEAGGDTRFQCAKLSLDGQPITGVEWRWSDWFTEGVEGGDGGHDFAAAPSHLMGGMEKKGDENGYTRYWMVRATVGGKPVYARVERQYDVDEHDHHFTCPQNQVIVGRDHYSDEEGPTGYLCATVWTMDEPVKLVGKFTIRHYDANTPCVVDVFQSPGGIRNYRYTLDNDAGCNDNEAGSFDMIDVPSATRILVSDDITCDKSKGIFWIELRTTRQPTSIDQSRPLRFAEIVTRAKGALVVPGVQLIDYRYTPGGDLSRSLSCMDFTTSALPPPASP